MRKLSLLMLLAVMAVMMMNTNVHAGDDHEGWTTDFNAAKKQAAAENKLLFIKFTGSDWCPPCINLWNNLFSKEEFRNAASKEYVLVYLDYPREKPQTLVTELQNRELSEQYGITGYPTVVITDAEGTELYRTVGGQSDPKTEPYLQALRDGAKTQIAFIKLHKQIEAAEGLEKVKLIDQFVQTYPDPDFDVLMQYTDMIIKLDPDNKSGVAKKYHNITEVLNISQSLSDATPEQQVKAVKKILVDYELAKPFAQHLYMIAGAMNAQIGDFDAAVSDIRSSIKAFPESTMAKNELPAMLEQIQSMKETSESE